MNSLAIAGDVGLIPWVRKFLWRRKWQPTPVHLPGKSHGHRRLVGYSSWRHRVRHDLANKRHHLHHREVSRKTHLFSEDIHSIINKW